MIYRYSPDAAWTQVEEETVVLNVTSEWMYGLNEAGGKLWQALHDGALLSNLLRTLAPEGTEAGRYRPFVERFLDDLKRAGLILTDGPEEPAPEWPEAPWPGPGAPPGTNWKEKTTRFGPNACIKGVSGGAACSTDPRGAS